MESQRFHSQAVREAVGLTWERLGLSADPQPDHRAYLCLFFSLHALQQQQLRQEQQKGSGGEALAEEGFQLLFAQDRCLKLQGFPNVAGTCSSMALALPSYEELSRAAQALRSSPEKGLLSLLELQVNSVVSASQWCVMSCQTTQLPRCMTHRSWLNGLSAQPSGGSAAA
jgi:hypothetical protein